MDGLLVRFNDSFFHLTIVTRQLIASRLLKSLFLQK